jgi:hypothetical protein
MRQRRSGKGDLVALGVVAFVDINVDSGRRQLISLCKGSEKLLTVALEANVYRFN